VRPRKSALSVQRAKRFRRELTKPEFMLWQYLRASSSGHKFRKQHPAGPYVLDFFCARANLAIEVDGMAHDTDVRADRDVARDAWLLEHRIDTLRIPAVDVVRDVTEVTNKIIIIIDDRLLRFGKAPVSSLVDGRNE
jgi:very-short-patch-repair endonuclease